MNTQLRNYRIGVGFLIGVLALSVMGAGYAVLVSSLGVLAAAVSFVVVAALLKALPLLAMKWDNKILQLQKDEATENPIITRQNIAIQKDKAIATAKTLVASFAGRIETVNDQIAEHKKKFSQDTKIIKSEEALAKMRMLRDKLNENIAVNTKLLSAFRDETAMLESQLKIALGVQNLAEAMNQQGASDVFNSIMSEAARDSVAEQFNTSMAVMDQLVSEMDQVTPNHSAIEYQPSLDTVAFGVGITSVMRN